MKMSFIYLFISVFLFFLSFIVLAVRLLRHPLGDKFRSCQWSGSPRMNLPKARKTDPRAALLGLRRLSIFIDKPCPAMAAGRSALCCPKEGQCSSMWAVSHGVPHRAQPASTPRMYFPWLAGRRVVPSLNLVMHRSTLWLVEYGSGGLRLTEVLV